MSKASFKHTPLHEGQIRLLTLSRTNGQISCSLTAHSFQKCPAYFALSYVWGPPPPEHEILVNGCTFMIRENLHACLSSLLRRPHELSKEPKIERPPWRPGQARNKAEAKPTKTEISHFWIDQLCIDQTSIAERNAQVTLMDQIYARTTETVVWVGAPTIELKELIVPLRVLGCGDPDLDDICRILTKPYWTRLWIVQEFLLSPLLTIRYGDESYDWDMFESLARDVARVLGGSEYEQKLGRHQDKITFQRAGLFMGLPDAPACLLNDRRSEYPLLKVQGGRGMSMLLNRFAQQECEMLVDKVYALQSLMYPRARIEIDYSLKPEELLYEVVDKLASSEGDDVFEEEQMDVCLAVRRALKVPATKQSSERMARTILQYVVKRLESVGECLSAKEQEIGLSWYLRYLEDPGSIRIPFKYRLNSMERGTYKEFMMEKIVSDMMDRASLAKALKNPAPTVPSRIRNGP
ncbi:hypothetical protein FB567DRAFT_345538 [Paraphoma chrysanthemicola]|uniref:Heterokaryon incompatibility domain-containing protein n=1 Tax=Paraphoma chrysanthemicola TaxID=798071 RepID=A0A8K0R686_9PLEO|nr:hypothetical protein FB567DRAFT_345538 [Paraphoma chrysanthemicola]